MKIAITGTSGFVGQNLTTYLQQHNNHDILKIGRAPSAAAEQQLNISAFLNDANIAYDAMVHLAGKAHDLKKTANNSEYDTVNFELTRSLFDHFNRSAAGTFIFISSVKAVADIPEGIVTENTPPSPGTPYGVSKLKAEEYINNTSLAPGKKVYILRPCMVHGPGNKGNLNLLTGLVKKNIPYPLAAFQNKRSFLSIENLCFVINEILSRNNVPSGTYNVADDESISTNELVQIIGMALNKKPHIWKINKGLITVLAKLGDLLHLPFSSENMEKLTGNYVVSNKNIISALGKPLPVTTRDGLIKTLNSLK